MPLKSKIDQEILHIVEKLNSASHETYIVGGAVRDMLLGINPKDYDIATSATPEQIKAVFKRNARIIGRRFRLVHYSAGRRIVEISTFRREPAEHEKLIEVKGKLRPNENTYGNASEDAWRRDLTVNAIFYDPISDKIIDFTGMGAEDLKKGIVRTVGDPDKRFSEDPVRILRSLKLVGQYNFSLEEKTLKAINRHKESIKNASSSRLSLELEKILKSQYSAKILSTFFDFGFMECFLPKIASETEKNPSRKKLLLDIMTEWNSRISHGEYRNSISVSLASISIPFVLDILELEDIDSPIRPRWQIESQLSEKFKDLLSPYTFPKRLTAVSREILLMQPILLKHQRSPHVMNHRRFEHARELFKLLNKTVWNNEELEQRWTDKNQNNKHQ
ncbi:MAG TPA: hypothetical protein PK821_07765 [Victivallales bacterium]|nr:hypothetical protein [Victivallales bacterium]